MSHAYPMLSGKFDWYNPNTGSVVCPINYLHSTSDAQERLIKLAQLGVRIAGEIDMPVDIGVRFYYGTLPKFLTLVEDEDPHGVMDFVDETGRARLRIMYQPFMMGTNIWTRYQPTDDLRKRGGIRPVVIDISNPDAEDGEVIWTGPALERGSLAWEAIEKAKAWLDTNKPNWRNPTAYWDEE